MATEWKSQQADGMFYLQFETDNKGKYMLVEKAVQMAIDGKTTADVVEVKHGKWLKKSQRQKVNGSIIHRPCLVCSICERKHFALVSYNYCPNCGAKMDGNNLSTIPTGSEGRG